MAIEQILHMNGGDHGETSTLQRNVMVKTKHIIEDVIIKLYSTTLPECLAVADLGCSSGPNALMVPSTIIKTIDATSEALNCDPPMFQFFLNDLFANDFNTIFKSLPEFYKRVEEKGHKIGPCIISGTPGTFYGRLFPNNSIHFFHSSISLHWLSQTPKELMNEAEPLNRGAIYLTKESPEAVQRAYFEQFRQDFKLFLKSRSQELLPNGAMVLTFAISDENLELTLAWEEVIAMALTDMLSENIIEKKKLDSHNISSYFANTEEVRQVIHEEGSFNIEKMETMIIDLVENVRVRDINGSDTSLDLDEDTIVEMLTNNTRSVTEPLLKPQFGEEIMDELSRRYKSKIIELMRVKKLQAETLVTYMTKIT